MQKITNYCDGCGKKLEGERLVEAQEHTRRFNSNSGRTETTIFCFERCSALSLDYWGESAEVQLLALTTASKAIDNHRRKFFSNTTLREASVAN